LAILWTGLIRNLTESQILKFATFDSALTESNLNDRVVVYKVIGVLGYYADPKVHIIDPMALTDPLLSKLPCRATLPFDDSNVQDTTRWRIGHFEREIPDGYIETVRSGTNKITDPNLSKYYDVLSSLIKGNIWDIDRFDKIWNFNTGKYDYLLEKYERNKKYSSIIAY
jgi:arabinofuranosyltransferase